MKENFKNIAGVSKEAIHTAFQRAPEYFKKKCRSTLSSTSTYFEVHLEEHLEVLFQSALRRISRTTVSAL